MLIFLQHIYNVYHCTVHYVIFSPFAIQQIKYLILTLQINFKENFYQTEFQSRIYTPAEFGDTLFFFSRA